VHGGVRNYKDTFSVIFEYKNYQFANVEVLFYVFVTYFRVLGSFVCVLCAKGVKWAHYVDVSPVAATYVSVLKLLNGFR
jgi:hypothetical protein